ncbi:unnamed protein product [Nesidiocoris tenuis]|uniref:Double jelly roll-like domain-containing protein n=2 Tax=Nesidiocoris tenuis TaxID=355587 RepID=A0A6H5G8Z7_9HEMI|nr:unnamed protein product [Nesidiocoris tenuis]CAA9998064.1 unnamed protein product [Nesidiocoris tenuis]CAA9999052.1 unnamed protein product [Nesidiocoris tenuis]CAB0003513.1 unnamed protein product [Nesidiocoris tenuis]CAB0003890.1 unnamed protein product [Nesidiocoris tenuis]
MLDVQVAPDFDDSLTKIEFHPHEAYASSRYGNSDEIRIPFSQADTYVLLNKSYLYIEGKLTKSDRFTLAPNGLAHGIEDIKLLLNGEVVDQTHLPGISSTMKGYCSFPRRNGMESAGWVLPSTTQLVNPCVDSTTGQFSACVPLATLLGIAEDYKKIFINVRMELCIVRSTTNKDMIAPRLPEVDPPAGGSKTTGDPDVSISKMIWYLPYVTPSDSEKIKLLNTLERDMPITVPFRSWSLAMYPTVPEHREFTWSIKSSSELEKPRFILFMFQTDRQRDFAKNMSLFDHNNLTNLKVYIGSQEFPYSRMNLDFKKKRISLLYRMYSEFQKSFYGKDWVEPMLDYDEFISHAPIVVVDCSYQVESVTSNSVDVRLQFETSDNVAPNTSAYCLMLHDTIVTYTPLSGIVRKGI